MNVRNALKPGEKAVKESDPRAPIVTFRRVPFQEGEWHHIVLSWSNLDTGKANGLAQFYVDGKLIGELKDRNIAMKWETGKTGVYFAVSYIGLLDELVLFNRPLTKSEVLQLKSDPAWLNRQRP